jgi:methyltransferase (TIGR00027 family)
MALRTRFIDNEVMQATTEGTSQFVLVGAGYDGRALRFRQPGARWFEVDHPATQPDKQRRMSAVAPDAGGITFVPVDLLRDDVGTALANAGHDASQPSLFICEGLFTYLPNAVVSSLCARLRAVAAPRSVLVASVLVVPESGGGIAQRFVNSLLAALGERRLGIFHPGTTESLLQSAGWTVSRRAASADYNASSRRLLLITAEAE